MLCVAVLSRIWHCGELDVVIVDARPNNDDSATTSE